MMKQYKYLGFFILMTMSSTLWAYGSSSSSKACAKPEFSNFVPANNANVAEGSAFSFFASANTLPKTIKVVVKELPTIVKITPKKEGGYLVDGTLPASLKGVYARIAITADGQNNCKGNGGWLIKISE